MVHGVTVVGQVNACIKDNNERTASNAARIGSRIVRSRERVTRSSARPRHSVPSSVVNSHLLNCFHKFVYQKSIQIISLVINLVL